MPARPFTISLLFGALLSSTCSIGIAQGAGAGTGQADTASSGSAGGAAKAGGAATTATVPMVILVPVEVQSEPQLYKGCWVRLVDPNAMAGKGEDMLTIVGKMYMPRFETPSKVDWSRKTESLIVGPSATATLYSDPNFQGKSAVLKPNQQVQNLRKEIGFGNPIGSIKVECTS